MDESKHIIWSDVNLDYDDWKADLEAEYPDMTDDQRIALMYEINGDYLNDERANLDIQLSREIIVIADLGLWNGRVQGYKMIHSGNIKDCLSSDCDSNEWYVDKKGNFRCIAHHHDGTNYYLYRVIKPDATDEQVSRLQHRIFDRKVTNADISRVTERLGDKIGAVYGWEFPHRTKPSIIKEMEKFNEQIAREARKAPARGHPDPAL